jgi:hypothetical protein
MEEQTLNQREWELLLHTDTNLHGRANGFTIRRSVGEGVGAPAPRGRGIGD